MYRQGNIHVKIRPGDVIQNYFSQAPEQCPQNTIFGQPVHRLLIGDAKLFHRVQGGIRDSTSAIFNILRSRRKRVPGRPADLSKIGNEKLLLDINKIPSFLNQVLHGDVNVLLPRAGVSYLVGFILLSAMILRCTSQDLNMGITRFREQHWRGRHC
jgi:hypothetical protein